MTHKTLCRMEFTKDHEGQELLLKDGKFQVMMEWEKPYMQACIDALQPKGHVLEIGFGCGYAATHIQTYKPISHTIIECHPLIAEKARSWAKKNPNIFVVEDTWQAALQNLAKFDAVFFDDYPLESEEETNRLEKMAIQAPPLVQKGQQLVEDIYKTLPQFKNLVYQKQDLDFFLSALPKEDPLTKKSLQAFFFTLAEEKYISQDLLQYALIQLVEKGFLHSQDLQNYQLQSSVPSIPARDGRLFTFLIACFEKHMHPNAFFSCYLESSQSKFEDPLFMEKIIQNPFMDYKEHLIDICVPPHCNYFKDHKALVMTIQKLV